MLIQLSEQLVGVVDGGVRLEARLKVVQQFGLLPRHRRTGGTGR